MAREVEAGEKSPECCRSTTLHLEVAILQEVNNTTADVGLYSFCFEIVMSDNTRLLNWFCLLNLE